MARTRIRDLLGILAIYFLIGTVTPQRSKQSSKKLQGPAPLPLLPPVPPAEYQEFLTKQQLSFIRAHQRAQVLDKIPFSPQACLPKYICIVEDEEGNKRTTIVNGLHPVLRGEQSQNRPPHPDKKFVKPAHPPIKKFNVPKLSVKNAAHASSVYKNREEQDDFLWDQEIRENLALDNLKREILIHKKKQFKLQETLKNKKPTSPSGEESEESPNNKKSGEIKDDESAEKDTNAKSSSEEEKDLKSEENEDKKSQERESEEKDVKSEEKDDKKSEEADIEKSDEETKNADPEESTEDEEDRLRGESNFNRNVHPIQEPGHFHRRPNPNSFFEKDISSQHLATVPWDDTPKNKSSEGIISRFQSAIFPFGNKKQVQASESKPGFLKRVLGRGKTRVHRARRDTNEYSSDRKSPFVTKLGIGIRSSDQCRILYNGCSLGYDEVMTIAANGQVLIEGDDPKPKTSPKLPQTNNKNRPFPEDDEADQALRDWHKARPGARPNNPKPRPGGPGYKVQKKPLAFSYGNAYSPFNKNKNKVPNKPFNSQEEDQRIQTRLPVASYPAIPMKFHWGKPNFYNGRPLYSGLFQDLNSRNPTQRKSTPAPPTPTPKPPLPTPIFAKDPVYKKVNRTTTASNIIQVNATHALEVVSPTSKPYRPIRTPVLDKNGRPISFASAFTEIAGSSGGLHDFFDQIARTVGHQEKKPVRTTPRQDSKLSKRISENNMNYAYSVPKTKYKVMNKKRSGGKKKQDDDDSQEKSQEDDEEGDVAAASDEKEENDDISEEKEADDDKTNKNDSSDDDAKSTENGSGAEEGQADESKETKNSNENEEGQVIEVDLPEDMPTQVKNQIIHDLKNGGKKKNSQQGSGPVPVAQQGSNQQHQQRPPQGQVRPHPPPQGQVRPHPPPQGQVRPHPPPQGQSHRQPYTGHMYQQQRPNAIQPQGQFHPVHGQTPSIRRPQDYAHLPHDLRPLPPRRGIFSFL